MNNNANNEKSGNTSHAKHVNNYHKIGGAVKNGISFGSCLAMIISYTAWKSTGWAILHGILSWIYVIYYLIKYVLN